MPEPTTLTRALLHVRQQGTTLGLLTLALWGMETLDYALRWLTPLRMDEWGIRPWHLSGLKGIVLAPLLHVDFNHLAANTVPLLVLASLLLLEGTARFWKATAIITLLSGLAVWVLGSHDSVYLGASGLVFGYLGYVFMRAWVSRKPMWIALAIGCAIIYGGLVASLLSLSKGVSWLGHLSGLIAGMAAARWLHVEFPKKVPAVPHNELHEK